MERYSNSLCSVLNTVVLCCGHLLHDQVSEKVALIFLCMHTSIDVTSTMNLDSVLYGC